MAVNAEQATGVYYCHVYPSFFPPVHALVIVALGTLPVARRICVQFFFLDDLATTEEDKTQKTRIKCHVLSGFRIFLTREP